MKHIVCIIILFFSWGSCAQQSENAIELSQLRLGLALGFGTITNPLNDGDNLPLIVIPDIAYYGERVYFDNGQLGFTLSEHNRHVFNLISEFNPENRFFVTWHPANVFIARNAFTEPANSERISISEINSPKWALDGGVNYQYIADTWRFSASVLHDISNVHKGQRVALSLSKGWQTQSGLLSVRLGLDYLSHKLADYYYGIQADDQVGITFQQNAAWLPHVELSWHRQINQHFGLLAKVKYHYYGSLSDSPLFSSNQSVTVFTGVTHVF